MRRLLIEEDAANYIGGVAPGTMAKWRTTGGGPKFIRIAANPKSIRSDVRYDVRDLDAWLDERRIQLYEPRRLMARRDTFLAALGDDLEAQRALREISRRVTLPLVEQVAEAVAVEQEAAE